MNALEKRCVDLSFRHRLTHVSSVLNAVNVVDKIYAAMSEGDIFVLGNGHASLAHYVVLESRGLCDAEEMVNKHGTHSSRDMERGIWVSNGSLGQAETIAVGMALADPKKTVWLVTSDGSCMEGSVYEAFRIASRYLVNLKVHIVFNGTGAYGTIRTHELPLGKFTIHPVGHQLPMWMQGLKGHYLTLNQEQHEELMR